MPDDLDATALFQLATSGLRDGRAWRALGSVLVGVFTTLLLFVAAVVGLSVSLALCVIGVGVPLTVGTLEGLAWLTGMERARAGWLGRSIGARPRRPGSILSRFVDRDRWRHAVYCLTAFFPTILAFVAVVVVWSIPIYFLTLPLWAWAVDALSWIETGALFVVGLVAVCVAPYATLGIGLLLARFTEVAIGPDQLAVMERQVSDLSQNRAEILTAVAAERRRIERNLHDGVQQRLVALGIDLGLAEAKLDSDPEGARALLNDAKEKTRASIGELRVIGRGLHPAILGDRGLDAALSAIVSDTSVPVQLRCDLAINPPEDVQETAFFVVSEALTNVMKHSGARLAVVDVAAHPDRLSLSIYDDGQGGATLSGTGLAGMAARVRGVDGSFELASPRGGPTTVSAQLPYLRPNRAGNGS